MSDFIGSHKSSQPCVSIIVPLYKAERYFPALLNALQSQTLENIEMIFVDDRGGDRSLEIAQKAALTDKRIKCLQNEENSGPGYSRNRGIEAASGEYIAFADADDIVAEDFYNRLYTRAKEKSALVAKGQLRRFQPDGTYVYSRMHEWMQLYHIEPDASMLNRFVYEHTCGIYSRELVMQSGARYAEDTRFGEDTFFLLRLMLHVQGSQFVLDENAVYTYRVNQNSIIQEKKDASFLIQVQTSALAKLDLLLQQENTEAVVWYLNYLYKQCLGDIVNEAILCSIPDNAIIQYIEQFVPRLKAWKESAIKYSPEPHAYELQNSGYLADIYLKKRKAAQPAPPATSSSKHNECAAVKKTIDQVSRFITLHDHMPKLKRRYRVLRLRRLLSHGKSKSKCSQKIAHLKSLMREYVQIRSSLYNKHMGK